MKTRFTIVSVLMSLAGLAQIPAGYYNSATGTGYTLKTQLKTIVTNGHNPQPYTTGLWSLYSNSLRDNFYENDGTLLDIYSENPAGPDPYNYFDTGDQCGNYSSEGDCYNKEHLIPKSYFNDAMPMYSDAHHVVPSDGKVNGWRGNLPFGVVTPGTTSPCNGGGTNIPCNSQNNSKLGNNYNSGYSAGFSGKVFEPIDEFKGDIARTYFYFATRYESQMAGFYNAAPSSTEVTVMFDGSANKVFSQTFLNILLTWHAADPVSDKEIAFNNSIYSFQGNRNPFIDRPEYVNAIWGLPLSTGDIHMLDALTVYPNPSNTHQINISSPIEIDNIQLININGQIIQQISKPSSSDNDYSVDNLPQGFYFLTVVAKGTSTTRKVIIN
ncbi:MAG: T9SS type A sorting domain-containing protein [Flavobacterium sp.]|nr:MAG: T9SS type A sorting domain-containing protein [Flavobacterium sp.]